MTIGEVLAVLKPEFSDITVSKLRFLEGAGLVAPDRTAAGYRKFSQDDVDRLRFVLRAQRDEYLPLRVIRQRLLELERSGGLDAVRTGGTARQAPAGPRALASVHTTATGGHQGAPDAGAEPSPDAQQTAAHFTREELCKAAGADGAALQALESFGLVPARNGGYTQEDLLVLRLSGELRAFGLEPRHLRMYKTFAEREATLFGQVVAPLLRQRNPEAHQRARDDVERLAALCGQLREAVLRTVLHGPDAQ
jgi:DNA-binding transcriptional MerR regulator